MSTGCRSRRRAECESSIYTRLCYRWHWTRRWDSKDKPRRYQTRIWLAQTRIQVELQAIRLNRSYVSFPLHMQKVDWFLSGLLWLQSGMSISQLQQFNAYWQFSPREGGLTLRTIIIDSAKRKEKKRVELIVESLKRSILIISTHKSISYRYNDCAATISLLTLLRASVNFFSSSSDPITFDASA